VLAELRGVQAWSVAVEYGFWVDARPEVFLRVQAVSPPEELRRSAWQRSLQAAMQANADALAEAVRSREPARFECLLGGESRVHPVYDLWLRLRGRSRGIELDHRRGG
jgi:hypothetical protein